MIFFDEYELVAIDINHIVIALGLSFLAAGVRETSPSSSHKKKSRILLFLTNFVYIIKILCLRVVILHKLTKLLLFS